MFNALKSMVNRVWDFIPWPKTQQEQRALTSLKNEVSQDIKKTEKKVRTRLTKEQKQLRDVEKRQKKYERERKKILASEKKVEREKSLRQRLLSDDEKCSLIRKLETESMSNEQRQNIERKLRDSKLETSRRKRQVGYKGYSRKRRMLDEKYSNLNEIFKGGVTVKKTEDIGNGSSVTYTIIPRNPTTATVSDFLQNSKSEALKLMNEFKDGYKFFMVLGVRLKKNRLLNNEVDYTNMHTSSKHINLNSNLDLDEIYDEGLTKMISVYLKKEHEGSG